VLAYRQAHPVRSGITDLLSSKLLPDDKLINRSREVGELVAGVDANRVVGCHGPRGAGKSFLLEHLADVINLNRRGVKGQPKPKRVSAALYFDLAASLLAEGHASRRSRIDAHDVSSGSPAKRAQSARIAVD
jgi:hypothetical protein